MLNGISAASGIGIGKAYVINENGYDYEITSALTPDEESERLKDAINEFTTQTCELANKLKEQAGEQQAKILQGHILILNDPFMLSETDKNIKNGLTAEAAVNSACNTITQMLSYNNDELTTQRISDINDIKERLIAILTGKSINDLSRIPKESVIVVHDLTPSMTAELNKDNIAGIITQTGSRTSHCAILARALKIPAVLGVNNALGSINHGELVIVDGTAGAVIVNPGKSELTEYSQMAEQYKQHQEQLKRYIGMPTKTTDGVSLNLFGNMGTVEDAKLILDSDGEGAGLFRTEFLFMNKSSLPNEEEQFEAYKRAAISLNGRPLIIRTMDIGGDKDIPYLHLEKEDNPFLGYRGIRYCLHNTDIFKTQLRAIIRASAYGDVRILLPMITGISELISVRRLINDISSELQISGISVDKIPVGIMIETPAAAVSADILAKYADFFSIGTNDLIQYTMAVDRGNSMVEYLYTPYNISFLRLLRFIINSAVKANIPVEMCGECAADKTVIPLLLSFGLNTFSVSPSSILETRMNISQWTIKECDKIANDVLQMSDSEKIRDYLTGAVNQKQGSAMFASI